MASSYSGDMSRSRLTTSMVRWPTYSTSSSVLKRCRLKRIDECASSALAPSAAITYDGSRVDEAAKIKNTDIVNELKLPPVKIHCSVLAEDAIKAAIADYKAKRQSQAEASKKAG